MAHCCQKWATLAHCIHSCTDPWRILFFFWITIQPPFGQLDRIETRRWGGSGPNSATHWSGHPPAARCDTVGRPLTGPRSAGRALGPQPGTQGGGGCLAEDPAAGGAEHAVEGAQEEGRGEEEEGGRDERGGQQPVGHDIHAEPGLGGGEQG